MSSAWTRGVGSNGRLLRPADFLGLTRRQVLRGVAAAWVVGTAGTLLSAPAVSAVEVVHWANGHMMNKALLPRFAELFNQAGHRTQSGKAIVVKPVLVNSGEMLKAIPARIAQGSTVSSTLPDPTVITPAADHWLRRINYSAGLTVVEPEKAQTLAITWVGIATYREMAEVLGWPRKDIGIADVVALASSPQGWKAYPTAKAEWGPHALMSYTDPGSSSTGCSMLYALYCIAAGKAPEQLTTEDVTSPAVVDYVKTFQGAVDHYVFDTLTLNSKIYGGPRYGHFFFIAETNLVQLYQGKIAVTVGGDLKPQPLAREMVFIYPKEGSTAHNHSANVLQADWVTAEQKEAAQIWIAFLREDAQQLAFMGEGFRPATGIAYVPPAGSKFVPDLNKPTTRLNPDTIGPAVAEKIFDAWGDIKKPGVVTFVIDTSGSMAGTKLDQAKLGIKRVLDAIPARTQVGLVTFSDAIHSRIPVALLAENRYDIVDAIDQARASAGTALYDAISLGMKMVDEAPAADNSIRGVVVVTDGRANAGAICLTDIVELTTVGEKRVPSYCGLESSPPPVDVSGQGIAKKDLIGSGAALKTAHQVHIFFVGVGEDKTKIEQDLDMDIGRVLAEGTNAAFQGVADKDLATVIENFGKYF